MEGDGGRIRVKEVCVYREKEVRGGFRGEEIRWIIGGEYVLEKVEDCLEEWWV